MNKQVEKEQGGRVRPRYAFAIGLMDEVGLKHEPGCFLGYRFILALLAGVLFLVIFHGVMPPFSSSYEFSLAVFLSLVIWQPLIEELLFRGIIQGQLGKRQWGKIAWQGISRANMITSILFVAAHMVHSSPLFAVTVIVPSLIFGYFRDYCHSVYPSIVLHSAYNAMVFAGLILNGNMNFPG